MKKASFNKITSLILVLASMTILSGCNSVPNQAGVALRKLESTKAQDYFNNTEKNGIYVAVKKMSGRDMKKYYDENPGSLFKDVYLVTVTNDSDNQYIFHASGLKGVKKDGTIESFKNNTQYFLKKADPSTLRKVFEPVAEGFFVMAGAFSTVTIIAAPAFYLQSLPGMHDSHSGKYKYEESYYQVTYDKTLKSKILGKGESSRGFVVLPKGKYKELVLSFQNTGKIEYFDINTKLGK